MSAQTDTRSVGARLAADPTTAAWLDWLYQAAQWFAHRAQARGVRTIDPILVPVIARLESGRDLAHELQSFNFWGIKGEWGPILSARTAELFAVPQLRVGRDYSYTSSNGQSWRAYPTPAHAVADVIRMLSTGRYADAAQTTDAAEQLARIQRAGYHPHPYWIARTWLQLNQVRPLDPARLAWARANVGPADAR